MVLSGKAENIYEDLLKNIRLKLYPGIDAMSHGELKEINRLKSF